MNKNATKRRLNFGKLLNCNGTSLQIYCDFYPFYFRFHLVLFSSNLTTKMSVPKPAMKRKRKTLDMKAKIKIVNEYDKRTAKGK